MTPEHPDIDRVKMRQIARHAADTGETPDVSALSIDDIASLIYEFGVYQNELLAQNEELEHMKTELETSRDEMAELYEFAPIGYVTLDAHANVMRANLTACDMLHTRRADLIGASLLKWLVPEKHHQIRRLLRATVASNKGGTLETGVHAPAGSDSTRRYFRLETRLDVGRNAGMGHCLVALMDITDQKQLESDLTDAKQAAEEHAAAKSTFLANMSHEIRTPMNGVLGMIQLLERRTDDPESRRYLSAAQSSAKTLLTIISDILDLSKIDAGMLDVAMEPVAVASLLDDVRRLFEQRSAETSIPLSVHMDDNVPRWIEGDGVRIRQVLFNLIGNAFKFTEEGEIRVHVRERSGANDRARVLAFTVTDTGVGIDANQLDEVRQPFVQVRTSLAGKIDGTGLGLAIVDQLVQLMGGRFTMESQPGEGTAATFTIPYRPAEAARPSAPAAVGTASSVPSAVPDASRSPATEAIPPARSYRLLVAEDNEINCLALATELRTHGHHVRVVHDGVEVLECLGDGEFDAILMDIQMPNMDGIECTRHIRRGKTAARTDIPIVALTGYAMDEERLKLHQEGIDHQISKPIDFETLHRELAHVIEQHIHR